MKTRIWTVDAFTEDMTAFQASRRGGIVRVRLDGGRVLLGGRAVTIMRGELTI